MCKRGIRCKIRNRGHYFGIHAKISVRFQYTGGFTANHFLLEGFLYSQLFLSNVYYIHTCNPCKVLNSLLHWEQENEVWWLG